jgi:hypothetical protein
MGNRGQTAINAHLCRSITRGVIACRRLLIFPPTADSLCLVRGFESIAQPRSAIRSFGRLDGTDLAWLHTQQSYELEEGEK